MLKNSIQFFGLPGSGKTFTLNSLLKMYPESYKSVPNFSKRERFKLCILFVLRFPRVGIRFFLLLLNNNTKLWSYIAHLVSNSFAAHMYVLLQKEDGKTFLIDEGIFQRILSVSPARFKETEAKKIIRLLYSVPSKVIITKGGDFGRFTLEPDRMMSHRNKLGNEYYKKWSENLVYNFQTISNLISKDVTTYEGKTAEELHTKIQS